MVICQTKEEQIDWIQKISKQLENNSPIINTTYNKSVSHHLGQLSDYFAHLVCKGVITRSLMKLILYSHYINNIDTTKVVRRYANASNTCINKCSKGTQSENESDSYNIISPKHCSSIVLKEDGNIIYGKKLFFTPAQGKACQDLTMSTLYKEDINYINYPNCLNYESSGNGNLKHLTIPLLNTENKNEIYLSDNRDSTFSLCDLKRSCCYENYDNNCDNDKDTEISQDFQYFKCKDHNSLRSSDSGLADITIPVTQQSLLLPTETSSSNSEHLCKCNLSSHVNSCIFEDDSLSLDKTPIPFDKNGTFRSELYAHWLLKKKLLGSCDSGKI